jgi:predicted metal-binding membrane protein
LGIMNIALMAVLTAVIFAEKVLLVGRLIVGPVAGALLLYGALLLFVPGVPGPGGMMA